MKDLPFPASFAFLANFSSTVTMPTKNPPNAIHVRAVVEERLKALEGIGGAQETVTVEWRGQPRHIPVVAMPVALLSYNPDTHRLRAQRSLNPRLEKELQEHPFGTEAQNYLHDLLKGDPTDPTRIDPDFTELMKDLGEHSQTEPGIITRAGVLINGNTRQAALKELGVQNIRVGVLPEDASQDDLQSIELSLQLRKDHRRDYSFMNALLAIDERAAAGQLPVKIQQDFRIKATTFERSRWILEFVREAIRRSSVTTSTGETLSMRLVDFETHKGKLEELYRAYVTLKAKSTEQAEALREQRLLALVLGKSKTDLRLIEPDFVKRYMKSSLGETKPAAEASIQIPGTSISVAGPSQDLQVLRELANQALRARAIDLAPGKATQAEVTNAGASLARLNEDMLKGLEQAGKQFRVLKRRLGPAERVSDACDSLEHAVAAIAEARSTGNFDASDLDEPLMTLKVNLDKLATLATRGSDVSSDGIAWLRSVANLPDAKG